MILGVFIVVTLAIGWFVPRLVMDRVALRYPILMSSAVACALGAAVIWIGAQAAGTLGLGDAQTEFDRGFSAWKIMLFLAPAAALHRQKQRASEGAAERAPNSAPDHTPEQDP